MSMSSPKIFTIIIAPAVLQIVTYANDLAMQSNFGFYNIAQLIFMYEIHCY